MLGLSGAFSSCASESLGAADRLRHVDGRLIKSTRLGWSARVARRLTNVPCGGSGRSTNATVRAIAEALASCLTPSAIYGFAGSAPGAMSRTPVMSLGAIDS